MFEIKEHEIRNYMPVKGRLEIFLCLFIHLAAIVAILFVAIKVMHYITGHSATMEEAQKMCISMCISVTIVAIVIVFFMYVHWIEHGYSKFKDYLRRNVKGFYLHVYLANNAEPREHIYMISTRKSGDDADMPAMAVITISLGGWWHSDRCTAHILPEEYLGWRIHRKLFCTDILKFAVVDKGGKSLGLFTLGIVLHLLYGWHKNPTKLGSNTYWSSELIYRILKDERQEIADYAVETALHHLLSCTRLLQSKEGKNLARCLLEKTAGTEEFDPQGKLKELLEKITSA